jgi:hypothetical protein
MLKKINLVAKICLILAILLNINWLKLSGGGLILGSIYLLAFGTNLGQLLFRKNKISRQFLLGLFLLLSSYSLLGAIIYLGYKLDQLTISLIFILISGLILYFSYKDKNSLKFDFKLPTIKPVNYLLIFSYLILFIIQIFILWQARTDQSINSPWEIIPASFFFIYVLGTINLISLLLFNKNFISTILLSLHFFLTSGLALIIYKLGYGFDPFIHQATELAIWQKGLILPKPFYYLGQYSLIIFLAHLLQISVELIDKLLVPLLLSIFVPYFILFSLAKSLSWPKNICRLLTLTFLFLPFNLFLTTNPQALANLYVIIILFLSFLYLKGKFPFYPSILLALTALFIHALAGLPIIIYLILIFLIKTKIKYKKLSIALLSIISSSILPLALYVNSLISIYKVKFDWQNFFLLNWPDIFSRQYNFWLDLAYLYQNSIYLISFLLGTIALIYLYKKEAANLYLASFLTFIILIINSLLLRIIKVSYIADYEQTYFSDRVWQLAFYFLLPLIINSLYWLAKNSLNKKLPEKIFIFFIFSFFLTSCLYLSYPRYDDYDNSNFFNLSQLDLEVVKYIDHDCQEPYIVLANQMTSAAALKTFGFTKYYNGYYFYPIPTGGQLYQYFLQMTNDNTSRQTMRQAMDLAGVNVAYFVLPTYWSRFKVIATTAEKDALKVINLNDQIFIYKYQK